MKKTFLLLVSLIFMLVVSGCQNAKTRAGEGAVIGGILGAAAGGIIGQQSHHAGEGVGIGIAAGALTGALVGSQIQKQPQAAQGTSQAQASQVSQGANPNQMPLQQIVELSRQGVNEAVIIDKIRLTNSRYNLSVDDINSLKAQGVSQKVIDVMQGKN